MKSRNVYFWNLSDSVCAHWKVGTRHHGMSLLPISKCFFVTYSTQDLINLTTRGHCSTVTVHWPLASQSANTGPRYIKPLSMSPAADHEPCRWLMPTNKAQGGLHCLHQWCGLRPSVLGQDRFQTKKSVLVLHAAVLVWVLVFQVWCCVVKYGLVTLTIIMILKDSATFQVPFIVSLFCAWNITTVEMNSGVHLLKS